MYSHRYQQILSKIAIFLVIFASFAPSISHGMAARNNNSSFLQEICSSNGTKKIVIQTITTQGQQLSAVFQAKIPQSNTPASTVLHLEHCPFCGSAVANIAIAPPSTAWIFMVAEQAKAIHYNDITPVPTAFLQTTHLTRAPPAL